MLRIILFLAAMFITGFLIVQENWNISIGAFGYEITISTVLLILIIVILVYLIYLVKKPFTWICGIKNKMARSHLIKKEAYLTFALKTILDQDNESIRTILNQKKEMLGKDDIKHSLLDALFSPTPAIFEQLMHQKETELAGIRGLFLEAKKQGDLKEADKLLKKAEKNYPHVYWILTNHFDIQVLQNDWQNALDTLEQMKKGKLIQKDAYQLQKATLLFKIGKIKEAYELDKTNPAIAIAYAKEIPTKAADILIDSWQKTPCWETYEAYKRFFENQSAEKQLKAVYKLVNKNPDFRISLIAIADTAIRVELWREAKETLTAYLNSYPLTSQIATMMATITREGWHHEPEAKEWEQKATEAEDKFGWMCTACNHKTTSWDACCPHCNAIGTIKYR